MEPEKEESAESPADSEKLSISHRNATPEKRSVISLYCRICHEDGSADELINPCECSGTLGLIHTSCLEKWLSMSHTDRCEICKHSFLVRKTNKPFGQACCLWWNSRNVRAPQNVTTDLICLMILTPLCVAATYLCGIGASAYSRLGFLEGTGLAILCCVLIATYFVWLIVTFRYHYNSWREWRRRNQDVKLLSKNREAIAEPTRNAKSERQNQRQPDDNDNRTSNRIATIFDLAFVNRDPVYVYQTTFV